MTVAPDAVEAAARAMYFEDCGVAPDPEVLAHDEYDAVFRSPARAALAAAAPLIAKQTLLDAADAWADVARAHGTPAELFLTARAATLTPKEN